MSWFDNLKEFVKVSLDIHTEININSNNSSEKIEYDEGEKTLSINIAKFNPKETSEIKGIINAAVKEDNIALLENKSEKTLESIKLIESDTEVESLLSYFKDKIELNDWNALRAAIYIRKRFENGTSTFDDTYKWKGDVIRKFGTRGKNICNLCTSGYFESLVKPLHEEMMKLPDFTNEKFLKVFDLIINEEAFAVFVSGSMSIKEVTQLIETKLKRNLKYGVNFVNIHGIGKQNVEKIQNVISNLIIEHTSLKKSVQESESIINAKLWF